MRSPAFPRIVRLVVGGLVVACLLGGRRGALPGGRRSPDAVFSGELALLAQVWGALLLASFVGWGGALNTWLFPRVRADLGLRCAWGWGIAVAEGGLLCLLGSARRPVLVAFTATGLLVPGWPTLVRALRALGHEGPGCGGGALLLIAADAPFLAGSAAIFQLGVLLAYAAVFNPAFNVNDDPLAYFQFAREIIEGGTLTQPFSLRRISAYSGKSLLDALTLAIDVPPTYLHLLDKGLALLTVLALVFGHARSSRRGARGVYLLAMLFVVSLPDTGINSSSMMTAVVFFLGLYRTMAWEPVAQARGLRAALPVALLAAGACTLRQNYLTTIAALLVVAYSPAHPPRPAPAPFPRRPRSARCGTPPSPRRCWSLFLSPWWALSWRWCGTFLFPMRKGFYNPRLLVLFPRLSAAEWMPVRVGQLLVQPAGQGDPDVPRRRAEHARSRGAPAARRGPGDRDVLRLRGAPLRVSGRRPAEPGALLLRLHVRRGPGHRARRRRPRLAEARAGATPVEIGWSACRW